MRTKPNYYKFGQWLYWTINDDPLLNNGLFSSEELFWDYLVDYDEYEPIPTSLKLSIAPVMLDKARDYFHRHGYTAKTPTLRFELDGVKNYDPLDFENDQSVPDFSTFEKMMTFIPEIIWHPSVFYYAERPGEFQERMCGAFRYIAQPAPEWFGPQFNMIYSKAVDPDEDSSSCELWHYLNFYHKDATDFFSFELGKWYPDVSVHDLCPNLKSPASEPKTEVEEK